VRFVAQVVANVALPVHGPGFRHPVPRFLRFVASRWLPRGRVGKVRPYQLTSNQEPIMKVRKNLEAVFLVAAIATNFASYAVAKVPAAAPVQAGAVVADQHMQVVVIKGHRLTPSEKAALG
jgi:hypothetical protein